MTKKILAILLALAMFIAMIPIALAIDTDSTGKIEFIDDGDDDGVYDPDDPPIYPDDPDDPDDPVVVFLNSLETMNLYFGEREIDYMTEQSYPAVDAAFEPSGNQDWWDAPRQGTGVVVVARAAETWQVQVAISGFTRTNGSGATLLGFDLDLFEPVADGRGLPSTLTLTAGTTVNTYNGSISAGPGGTVGAAAKIADGTRGIAGANFDANLNVLPNTAHPGEAKADLYWTFIPAFP